MQVHVLRSLVHQHTVASLDDYVAALRRRDGGAIFASTGNRGFWVGRTHHEIVCMVLLSVDRSRVTGS